MRKMFSKAVVAVTALSLSIGGISPAISSAAANYSVAVPVSYNNAAWNTANLWQVSSSSINFSSGAVAEGSYEFLVDFKISVPKILFTGTTAKADQTLQINTWLDLFRKPDEDATEYSEHVDPLNLKYALDCRKIDGKYDFSYWDEDFEETVSVNDQVTAVEKGDFVQITAKNMEISDEFDEDSESMEAYDPTEEYMYKLGMSFTGVYMKGNTSILLDEYTFYNDDGVVCSYDFSDADNLYIDYQTNNSQEKKTAPFVRSDYLLKVAKTKLSVKKGKKVTIKATTAPKAAVKYKTSNKKIATVTNKGVVKGIKNGKATITVTANGVSKKVTITVKK